MNADVRAAIETLIKNPAALTEFETWVDGANRTIKDSGAVTRSTEAEPVTLESLAATVAALTAKFDAIGQPATEPQTIELDEAAAAGIAQAVFSGAEFRTMADSVARLSGAMEAQSKALLDSVQALTDRVASLEKGDEEKLRAHDETKPQGGKVTLAWRAPRGKDEAKPTTEKTRSLAAAVNATEAAWNAKQ